MEKQVYRRLKPLLALIPVIALSVAARPKDERDDNLVRLMKADYIEQLEINGQQYRKAKASTFLHNGTYLISDSALWNVDTKIINCIGHVKVIQDETILTSDKLDYYIDDNLAQFRGTLVQLQNKKRNLLRTRNLDYNTRDSIATFQGGAAMRDEDGQLIESTSGTYDSNDKYFMFKEDVNMFSDSVFMRTSVLYYYSEQEKAEFPASINFWKGKNMLSAEQGWYDKGRETFFFTKRVHGLTGEQELWGDSLYYYGGNGDMLLLGNGQVQDTSRNVSAVADRIDYCDTLKQVTLSRNAAVALFTETEDKIDTIYIGADKLVYKHTRFCDVPEQYRNACKERLKDILTDAVAAFRKKAAEDAAAAAKAALEAANPNAKLANQAKSEQEAAPVKDKAAPEEDTAPEAPEEKPAAKRTPLAASNVPDSTKTANIAVADSTAINAPDSLASTVPADSTAIDAADSLASKAVADTTATAALETPAEDIAPEATPEVPDSLGTIAEPADTTAGPADSTALEPIDTTRYGFAWAIRNVKIFRRDIQVRCDSMVWCDLDSIARFYHDPIVWNEGNRQYTADSLFVLVGGGGVRKASLQSNAYVITQDDVNIFDQIKGAEIMAYFDSTNNTLKRFDALGGASALFYLEENGALATVNKVESKILSGNLKDGTIDQVFYFENPHNNAYPIVQLPEAEKKMKGFQWRPDERPASPKDVSSIQLKKSQRKTYRGRAQPTFKYAKVYFPGYIDGIRREIAIRDSLSRIPKPKVLDLEMPDNLGEVPDSVLAAADSLVAVADSLARDLADTLKAGGKAAADSLASAAKPAADSLAAAGGVDPLSIPTVDPKQKRLEERETRRKLRIAARDARIAERDRRWAQLDSLDAAKAAAKQQKQLEKERAAKLRKFKALERQRAKEEAKLEKYIQKYRKQYEREQQKSRSKVPADPGPGEKALRSDPVLRDDGPLDDDPVLSRGGVPGT